MKQGRIVKVSGPLVVADGMEEAHMADVVRVGEEGLIGEILNMTAARASIQVYEDTSMLMPGAAVESTGAPLSAELGPGLLGMIYDGIQRPLPGAAGAERGKSCTRRPCQRAAAGRKNGTLCRGAERTAQCSRGMFSAPCRRRLQWSTAF